MNRFFILMGLCTALLTGAPAFAQDAPPPGNEGAFEALSTGNQKVVSSIYESQLGSANDQAGGTLLTRDDIAAMKAEGGWGRTYKQLYAEGKVSYRNLGQAVSAYNHSTKLPATTATVVTTGSGQQITTGGKKEDGAASASAKESGPGGGNKGGLHKGAVITTAGGGQTVAGANSTSNAGGAPGLAGAGGAKGRGQGGASHKGK